MKTPQRFTDGTYVNTLQNSASRPSGKARLNAQVAETSFRCPDLMEVGLNRDTRSLV